MKAELEKDGTLVISAESSLEAYALKRWNDARTSRSGKSALRIDCSGEFYSPGDTEKFLASLNDKGKRLVFVMMHMTEETDAWLAEMEPKAKAKKLESEKSANP